jgi:hypothetical protein
MGLTLTENAIAALAQSSKDPNLVLKIAGVDRVFGASLITKYVRFGDGSDIGDPTLDDDAFYIGGMNPVADQDNIISPDGTSTSIKQTLNTDKGEGGSISTLQIALIDDGYVTELITPGEIVDDILQRQAVVYYGFGGTAWPDDYIVIFRGLITDVMSDPGKTVLTINHPDDKKRTNIFKKVTTKLLTALDTDDSIVVVDSVSDFLIPLNGPFGGYDPAFVANVRINDEIIKYTAFNTAQTTQLDNGIHNNITLGTPGSVLMLGHTLPIGAPVSFTTTGALPTGLLAGTTYYVESRTVFVGFTVSATPGGAAINFTGSQSGLHTVHTPAMLSGTTRAQLNTTAASHAVDDEVNTYYTLEGNAIDLALKLMLSGDNDTLSPNPYAENIRVDSINVSSDGTRYDNSLFFLGVNVVNEYGIAVGDSMSGLQAVFPNDGINGKAVTEIVHTELGDFVLLGDVTLADMFWSEDDPITAEFTSQYSTLPDGCRMKPDEVDIDEHVRLYRLFLNSFEYKFYLKDGIENAKDFLEQEIYKPIAAYSLPRKARASIGYHIGPIPGTNIKTFDETNIKNPAKLTLKRSTNKNFWNEIVYKYDEDPIEDKFTSGFISISQTSKNRIPGANRTMTIESRGMRANLSADTIADDQGERRLTRYQFGAETINVESLLDAAFAVEIGDIVIFDGRELNLPDIKSALKGMAPRFFEVANKDLQLKTGDVKLELIDTKFEGTGRYCLIAPASRVKSGISTTVFNIESSFASQYGTAEFRKWINLKRCSVRIRNSDFSVIGDTVIQSATSNTITVSPALAFTPSAGMIMELTAYDDADVTDQVKLIYAHMSDTVFGDGAAQYQML